MPNSVITCKPCSSKKLIKNYYLILLEINEACFGKGIEGSSFVTLFPLEVNIVTESTIAVMLYRVRSIFLNDCILILVTSKSNF